jgi:hypothetical protein
MLCLKCGKETRGRTKFCSDKCRKRYYRHLNHLKNKDNPKYKQKRKECFKKWLEKNRFRWNELCRKNSKLYQRKKRMEEKGLCSACFKPKKDKSYAMCEKCLEWNRNYQNKKYQMKKKGKNEE